MKRFRLLPVNSPSIELNIGGYIQTTTKIKSVKKNPNFDNPIVFFDVVRYFLNLGRRKVICCSKYDMKLTSC